MSAARRASLIVAALLVVAACGGAQAATTETAALPEPDIDGTEARALVESGAMLLDVTPASRAERSGIEGRTHIPLPELEARLVELPRDRTIVVYCLGGRGSPRAAALLRERGYEVRLLGARARWDGP